MRASLNTLTNFAAPAFLVKIQISETFILVVIYKDINERVIPDNYPFPKTQE